MLVFTCHLEWQIQAKQWTLIGMDKGSVRTIRINIKSGVGNVRLKKPNALIVQVKVLGTSYALVGGQRMSWLVLLPCY